MDIHGALVYSTAYHLLPILIILMLKLSPLWSVGVLSSQLYVLLACLHHSLSASLLSALKCFRLTLYFLCLSFGINHFFKEP